MMKHSSILKWTQTNRHNNSSSSSKGVVREWIHPPDALQRGHIAYLVKFLGSTEVDQPKGIDVVKEGIRKLKFSSQLRKSEGAKTPKVELTISIDGVAVQEPKTKRILHQYPLHRISYCADDKAEKKFFSFIAKEADEDGHVCFVFVSDKLAEEITLTIGQAFDLAYRRFLETSGRDLEMRKQLMILQKKIQSLETENRDLKLRIVDLQMLKDRHDVDVYRLENEITDLCVVDDVSTEESVLAPPQLIDSIPKPPLPSRSHVASVPRPNAVNKVPLSPSEELFQEFGTTLPVVGTKLENLTLDDFEDFNPRATTTTNGSPTKPLSSPETNTNGEVIPILQPPPPQVNVVAIPPLTVTNGRNHSVGGGGDLAKDLFGAEPFVPVSNDAVSSPSDGEDPFGMGDFGEVPTHLGAHELETAIGDLDKRLSEMRDGFSRGISFGNDDFSLESLDPLNSKQQQQLQQL